MFEIMKMLEIIAMTSIVMENYILTLYLPYSYHILIYLPYTYLMLIIPTRLDKNKSGEGQQQLTERETWIQAKFGFFHRAVNHRSKPVRSVSIDVDIYLII